MNRSERRRRERAARKQQPVLIAGDGIVAQPLGQHYEAREHAELPEKEPGVHRWVATGVWVLTPDMAEAAFDAATPKYLDHENLMALGIGCWDCERILGDIAHDSPCPAEAAA